MRILQGGYIIRRVDTAAINGVAALHKSAFRHGWEADEFALYAEDPGMRLLGAFQSGTSDPVAFLLVRVVADEAEVLSLAVGARHRRCGLGEGLMDAVIDELFEQGIVQLHLEVDETNKPAVALYEKLGFEIVGERRAYYAQGEGKPANGALQMTLDLVDE